MLAAAGDPDVKVKLLQGMEVGDKTFKNHLDGYDFMPFFRGEVDEGPRKEIFYFDDWANLNAVRYGDWKIHFQIMEGNFFNGKRVTPNMPLVINLRQDPFERFPSESMMYMNWVGEKLWTFMPAQVVVSEFLQSFKAFPPSQKPGSFSVNQALEALQAGASGTGK